MIIFSDQHCSGGRGRGKKQGGVKFPAIYFVWLRRQKSSKMKFFQVVLARIVVTKMQYLKFQLISDVIVTTASIP